MKMQNGSILRNIPQSAFRAGLAVVVVLALLAAALPAPALAEIDDVGTLAWSYFSGNPGALLGSSLSSAGDVNGDGFADVVIGAYLYERNDALQGEGRAYLFSGSSIGLESEPSWSLYGGVAFAHYGWAVTSAGDVNGDGYADVAVSATRCTETIKTAGAVYVYYGGSGGLSTTANWSANEDQAEACFGNALAPAGDVNSDGYGDLLVGAPYYDDLPDRDEGAVFLYYGSAAGLNSSPERVFFGGQANARLGSALSAGNFNNDGFSDVVLAAPGYSNGQAAEGQVSVYYGSSSGPADSPGWVNEINQLGANYGSAVSDAGDVNGDGYADLLIGADGHTNPVSNEGSAFLYLGGSGGLNLTPTWSFSGGVAGGFLGRSVSGAGDMNGDGYADLILGASHYADPEPAEGTEFIFFGSTTGPGSTPDWVHQLNQAYAMLGSAVSGAGDVNGDGFADVIGSAPGYERSTGFDEGLVEAFHGGSDGLEEPTFNLSLTPNPVNEASPITLYGSFTVPDAGASFTLTVDWGDGSPATVMNLGTARAFDTQHVYADSGDYVISVSLVDGVGTTLEGTAPVLVLNVAPSMVLSGASTVAEGVTYTINLGPVVDPGLDTVSACQIDWGDGSLLQDCFAAIGGSLEHIFLDGPASYTVRIHLTDEDGAYQNVATQEVNVTNVAPVAVDDAYTVVPGHPTTIPALGVLVNDLDVPADVLTASLVSGPSAGSLTLNANGSFTFTPSTGFLGTVSFTYRAADDDGGVSNTATVSLTVNYLHLYLPAVAKH